MFTPSALQTSTRNIVDRSPRTHCGAYLDDLRSQKRHLGIFAQDGLALLECTMEIRLRADLPIAG
jgi:hypothetical protein